MEKKRAVFKHSIRRYASGLDPKRVKDTLIAEEPFTLIWKSLDGRSERLTSTMRTPGDDLSLAAGILFGEGVISGKQELKGMSFCAGGGANELNRLVAEIRLPGEEVERRLLSRPSASAPQSACGLCAMDDLASPEVLLNWAAKRYRGAPQTASESLLLAGLKVMRGSAPIFAETGASHACVAMSAGGLPLAVAEDVGRHNACDKAIGRLLLDAAEDFQLPKGSGLIFSSRLSFELAAKACAVNAAWMASVGAPTHLAVELADRCKIPLYGFLSEDRYNAYLA